MQSNEWYSIHTFVGISHAGLFVLQAAIMATRVSALIAVSEPTNQPTLVSAGPSTQCLC